MSRCYVQVQISDMLKQIRALLLQGDYSGCRWKDLPLPS